MKKSWLFLCIGLLCFSFTGCIDIVHHISRKSDGTEQNTIKITIAKALFEMVSSISGEDANYDSFFDEYKLDETDIDEYNRFSAQVSKINTEFDIGYLVNININYNDKEIAGFLKNEHIDFIPQYGKNMMKIHIASSDKADTEFEQEALLLMASGKYRLFVSKSCMPSISTGIIKNAKGTFEVNPLDLNTEYLIEIPITFLLMGDIDIKLYR